jgi:squalene-hopene/tetraprenyl-beta-curcumene cyclase
VTPALPRATPAFSVPLDNGAGATLSGAIERTRRWLLAQQRQDGHWVGELQGDTILESEYILLMAFLGRENEERLRKAARYILQQQRYEGGWSNYPEGPFDLSVSTKAYFALKLTGQDPQAPEMRRACELIRERGGALQCNSFTRFYLALLGQLPYAACPSVPPELVLLPRWFPVNLYAMSSWTRTIVVPLSIFSACKPVRRLPPGKGIGELFLNLPGSAGASPSQPGSAGASPSPVQIASPWLSWRNVFLAGDRLYKFLEPILGAVRRLAVGKAAAWMRERLRDSDGLGAIFPPMIYTVIALRCLGVADDDPEMRRALGLLDELMIEENDTLRLQPCFSPVWDTALTLNTLAETEHGTLPSPAVDRGVGWLLNREVRCRGDWSQTNPRLEPGGWFFEYANPYYPDTDDTAMVLMALARTGWAERAPAREPARRGVAWLVGMQNRDGGWAAFDRNINRRLLTQVPFADHNAMLDPSCPDITARVLEALGFFGFRPGQPEVDRALRFLWRTQEPAGCWPGRWGVNYLYGTWQVLVGLKSIGVERHHPAVRKAVDWLRQVQQPCGGWGESCASYDDPRLAGQGTPTASQTAWALLGLIAAGEAHSDAVRAGIAYLLATQAKDGTWPEEQFTGTGFPKVFYLKYHLYAVYFPLMALARYRSAGASQDACPTVSRRSAHAFSPQLDDEHGGVHGPQETGR